MQEGTLQVCTMGHEVNPRHPQGETLQEVKGSKHCYGPLPLAVSCFSKIQIGFTFLVPAYLGNPGQNPENCKMVVCVCSAS